MAEEEEKKHKKNFYEYIWYLRIAFYFSGRG